MYLKSNIISILKNSFFYKRIYHPIKYNKIKTRKKEMHFYLMQEGKNLLQSFSKCMDENQITYWLEFGTLLGAYRDGGFIPNDIDIDVGAKLEDAYKIYHALTEKKFRLVREFHVIGENGLEQTYEYHGVTIDIMYFYENESLYWCNGVALPSNKGKFHFNVQVTSHWFKKFGTCKMEFMGLYISIPDNVEEHLIEIFGNGYKVYDPNFTGDLNKTKYLLSDKSATGFYIY